MTQDQDAETVAKTFFPAPQTPGDLYLAIAKSIQLIDDLKARLAAAEAENVRLGDDLETMVNVAAAGGYAGPTGWSFADREAELEKALTAIVRRLAAAAKDAPNPEPITDPMAVLVWIGNTAKDALDAIYQARAALQPEKPADIAEEPQP